MGRELKVDTLIVGAGVAGLATAYYLASESSESVAIIEQEEKLGGYASGRNAGMIRQAVADSCLARLAREGRNSLGRLERQGWKGLNFSPNGSLLLAKKKKVQELKQIASTLRNAGIPHLWFSRKHAEMVVSFLEGADFDKGLFCPSDASLDVPALLAGFLRALKKSGVRVFLGRKLNSIQKRKAVFVLQTDHGVFFANKVVNAAGAWAGGVAKKAHATPIPLKAYRRHLFVSEPIPAVKKSWPFVWDLSHDLYFRPVGARSLLLSPCDKKLFSLGPAKPKESARSTEPGMRGVLMKKLIRFSGHFSALKIKEEKAGLRTMAPDGRFVIGEDAKLRGFFWVAGLGGHGVTTCLPVGRLAADMILGRNVHPELKKAFSPDRF